MRTRRERLHVRQCPRQREVASWRPRRRVAVRLSPRSGSSVHGCTTTSGCNLDHGAGCRVTEAADVIGMPVRGHHHVELAPSPRQCWRRSPSCGSRRGVGSFVLPKSKSTLRTGRSSSSYLSSRKTVAEPDVVCAQRCFADLHRIHLLGAPFVGLSLHVCVGGAGESARDGTTRAPTSGC